MTTTQPKDSESSPRQSQKPRLRCGEAIAAASERAHERSTQRRSQPQPWLVLKSMVFVTTAIIIYAAYVFIGRTCVDLIQNRRTVEGVVLIVIAGLLFVMILWSYYKIISKPPGFAKHHVPVTTSPPPPSDYEPYFPYPDTQFSEESTDDHDFTGVQHEKYPNRHTSRAQADPASVAENGEAGTVDALAPSIPIPAPAPVGEASEFEEDFRYHRKGSMSIGSGSTAVGAAASRTSHKSPGRGKATYQTQPTGVYGTGATPLAPSHPYSPATPQSQSQVRPPSHAPRRNSNKNESAAAAYKPRRLPPTTPVLLPEWRYCKTCEIVKPYRTHHCRACGTCVLRYDHHCPWIGQCVGAQNHKFFMTFNLWAFIYCTYLFVALIVVNATAPNTDSRFGDPQQIVIIALALLFAGFTAAMFLSHARMIRRNHTTVESLGSKGIHERELAMLRRDPETRGCGYGVWRRRRAVIRSFDEEWGRVAYEGNLWWLGDTPKGVNWRSVMGDGWWWILPIGSAVSDGSSYTPNPRFDSVGRWRRRAEWPAELR